MSAERLLYERLQFLALFKNIFSLPIRLTRVTTPHAFFYTVILVVIQGKFSEQSLDIIVFYNNTSMFCLSDGRMQTLYYLCNPTPLPSESRSPCM